MVKGTHNRMKAQFSEIFCLSVIVLNYESLINDSLGFTSVLFGWLLPDDRHIYKTN